jgi:hypothetical protein
MADVQTSEVDAKLEPVNVGPWTQLNSTHTVDRSLNLQIVICAGHKKNSVCAQRSFKINIWWERD